MDPRLEHGDREIYMRKREIFCIGVLRLLPEMTPDIPPEISPTNNDTPSDTVAGDWLHSLAEQEQVVAPTSARSTRILPGISLAFERTNDSVTGGEITAKTVRKIVYHPQLPNTDPIVGFLIDRYAVSESLANASHSHELQPLKSMQNLPIPLAGLETRSIQNAEIQQSEKELGLQIFTNSDFDRIMNLIARCRLKV